MPRTHGFEILVEGADGVPFTTYGTRSLGQRIISTKIQAKAGVRFNIRITPQIPFPEPNDASPGASSYNMTPSTRLVQVTGGRDGTDSESSRAAAKAKDKIAYVAFVYMDGKKKAECTCNLIVDPENIRYERKGHLMEGRLSLADDSASQHLSDQDLPANMSVSPWVFSERGIDVLMGRMDISRVDPEIPSTAMEQDLVDLTQAMGNDNSRGAADVKQGGIEVRIARVVFDGEARTERYWKRGEEETPRKDDDRTHHVTVDNDQVHRVRMTSVKYRRYRPDEAFLCKAVFQYMDIAKLVNLGLCNAKGEPIERCQKHAIGSRLANLPRGHGAQRGQLKRLRGVEREQGKHGGSELAGSSSSNEEESDSDTTSDSDVPRRKRRGEVRGRKATALKEKKTLGNKEPATIIPSTDNPSLVPNDHGSEIEAASPPQQHVKANTGEGNAEGPERK